MLSLDWITKEGTASERALVQDFRVTLGLPQANTSDYQFHNCAADIAERMGDNWSSYGASLLFNQQERGVTAALGPALVGWALGSGELLATRRLDTSEPEVGGSARLQASWNCITGRRPSENSAAGGDLAVQRLRQRGELVLVQV